MTFKANTGSFLKSLALNTFVEWNHNGAQRGRHSSMLSAPLRPIHGHR
jgi:hypothetical protein